MKDEDIKWEDNLKPKMKYTGVELDQDVRQSLQDLLDYYWEELKPQIHQLILEKVKQAEDKGYAEGVRLTEKKYQGEILEAIEKTVEERNNFWRTIIKDASSSQKEAREEARREVMDKIINIIAKRMVESKTDKEVDFGQDVLKQLTEI
ncbi:MAG: hypothetical protein WC223_13110 [Bacteroidales bacterium]|jgi:hypothetical protein